MYSGLDYHYDEWCVCANCENKLFKYRDYYASGDFLLEYDAHSMSGETNIWRIVKGD